MKNSIQKFKKIEFESLFLKNSNREEIRIDIFKKFGSKKIRIDILKKF